MAMLTLFFFCITNNPNSKPLLVRSLKTAQERCPAQVHKPTHAGALRWPRAPPLLRQCPLLCWMMANPFGEGCSALLRVLRSLPEMVLPANSQASSKCSGWTVFSPEWGGGYFAPILCHVLSPGTKHDLLYLRVPQNLLINSSFRYIIGT